MDTNRALGIVGVAIIVIAACCAGYMLMQDNGNDDGVPDENVHYNYRITDVHYSDNPDLDHQYRASVEFPDMLPAGVRVVAVYDGDVVDEYTTTQSVSKLDFWFNLPYTASEQSVLNFLTLEFYS